jgi:galactokinase
MNLSYTSVREQFRERFGLVPVLFRAPGRINLIGEHTDYNDGFVMPAAIDREIVFAFALSDDSTTVIHAANMNETAAVDLEHIAKDEGGGWINYLLGVLDRLRSRQPGIGPFKCLFFGNIPTGSGLSSSAALECGFAYGLNALNNLGIPAIDLIHIAQWSEHHYAGVRCGIMDQFSSMMGKKDHVFMLDCRTLGYRYFPFILKDYEIVLFDTGVKHALANSEYNTRRGECEEGVRILQKLDPEIRSLRDVTAETVGMHKHLFPGKVFDRVWYVTGEIERVQAAAADLERGDLLAFGKKMNETHRGLSELYEVSCPELDFLVNESLASPDVLGARMMGGGFGGCVIAIIGSSAKRRIEEELYETYKRAFGIELKAYEVAIADGVGKIE